MTSHMAPRPSDEDESPNSRPPNNTGLNRRVLVALAMTSAALLGAFIALAVTASDPGAAAEARVRLHDDVDWPEHDAVRLEILGWLDEETFNATNEHVQGALHHLDAELPRNQSYLNITAKADDDESAVAAVDFAIARLTERDETFSMGPYRDDLAQAEASLSGVSAELEAVTPAAESGDVNAIAEQGALIWRVEDLEGTVDDARRQLAKRSPRIYQIGATKTSDAQRFRRLRIIAASALVAALATGAALTLLPSRLSSADGLMKRRSDAPSDSD